MKRVFDKVLYIFNELSETMIDFGLVICAMFFLTVLFIDYPVLVVATVLVVLLLRLHRNKVRPLNSKYCADCYWYIGFNMKCKGKYKYCPYCGRELGRW